MLSGMENIILCFTTDQNWNYLNIFQKSLTFLEVIETG